MPYGWQFRGEDVFVPSQKFLRLNIFGMIDRNNHYEGFSMTESITADKVADFLDRLSFRIKKDTFLVLDNAKIGTVVKRLKLYNRLIVNVIENSYLCVGKKNTSNRPRKAEFGGIAKINLHGKGTKFLRNITGSSVHRV